MVACIADMELTWERPGTSDDSFKHYLIRALLRSGVCVILEDGRADYLFVANLLDVWTIPETGMPNDDSVFGAALALRLAELKTQIRTSGDTGQIEAQLDNDRHFQFIVEPIPSGGDAVDLMTTIIEVSEERRREKVLRDLLREVSHRSKNLLAIIQSIAAQTARHSDNIDAFVQKFRGRLYSLSLSQDLITDSLWRGASFSDLATEQLRRYLPEAADKVTIVGGELMFSPNAALHIGLALHELIINAVTYGDVASAGHTIVVACSRDRRGDADMISFTWTETRQAEADTAEDGDGPHFGRAVLERVLPASVSGTASYTISPDEIVYRLDFPADSHND